MILHALCSDPFFIILARINTSHRFVINLLAYSFYKKKNHPSDYCAEQINNDQRVTKEEIKHDAPNRAICVSFLKMFPQAPLKYEGTIRRNKAKDTLNSHHLITKSLLVRGKYPSDSLEWRKGEKN